MNDKARAGVYLMAAFYMFYMAYQVFSVRMDDGGSQQTLMTIFSVFFALCGVGLIVFVIYMMKKNEKK